MVAAMATFAAAVAISTGAEDASGDETAAMICSFYVCDEGCPDISAECMNWCMADGHECKYEGCLEGNLTVCTFET